MKDGVKRREERAWRRGMDEKNGGGEMKIYMYNNDVDKNLDFFKKF